jgi:quinol monooxygenase YgiN
MVGGGIMLIVHVHVHVKAESVEAFQLATVENARHSVQEPASRVSTSSSARTIPPASSWWRPTAPWQRRPHRETAHYQRWRDSVAGMMTEPRSSARFTNVFPDDGGW